jgi:predicted transcriptional regulator
MASKQKQINVRLDQTLLDRLHGQADREERPISWVIRRAILDYCDRADQPASNGE